jgi:hypothetical protein
MSVRNLAVGFILIKLTQPEIRYLELIILVIQMSGQHMGLRNVKRQTCHQCDKVSIPGSRNICVTASVFKSPPAKTNCSKFWQFDLKIIGPGWQYIRFIIWKAGLRKNRAI